jgi:hypothetical protein
MHWRKQQEITEKYGLRPCSMGRCCNAGEIERLRSALQEILDFSIKDRRSTDDHKMIEIARKALNENTLHK